MVNAYNKIPLNSLELYVSGVSLRERVSLRIVPDKKSGLSEVRFWYEKNLLEYRR